MTGAHSQQPGLSNCRRASGGGNIEPNVSARRLSG